MNAFKEQANREITDLNEIIVQGILDPHIDEEDVQNTCKASTYYGFSGICTNLNQLKAIRKLLDPSGPTQLIAAIAFPFGSIPTHFKIAEAEWAVENGADQIDMVPDFSLLNENKIITFAEEIAQICSLGIPINVILNTNRLKSSLLQNAIEATIEAGASGIQTGNGFGTSITIEDLNEVKKLIKNRCEIKAVGGISTLEKALQMINTGANKICTSNGPKIMKQFREFAK